ncbi:YkgG family uncharacterized protein [Hydrogenispora ethanolica]|uniref:YkgG family uncharacterized protein n=1 Tax=Hydrogenispora ethanolica TaxID=1082276 RepID=A0A4V2QGM4_HYDET|nr:lactate utilization protein [Hydrogenispora ethanolica]TCL76407.1 YkgG family uncharacterized protein [Hydrogenispora ethanolica]
MDHHRDWYWEQRVARVIANLEKHNMAGFYVQDEVQLLAKVEELIPEGSVVAVGDSLTLFETGVIGLLRGGRYRFLDKHREGLTSAVKREIYLASFSADTFLCSTNALTEAGELYNVDGNGSRVAALLYGPEQVIVVAGRNKIVADLDEARQRVRRYAAPLDAKRLGKRTPCASLGHCLDCDSPERICNDYVVIKRQFIKGRIKVIIVGKDLGY